MKRLRALGICFILTNTFASPNTQSTFLLEKVDDVQRYISSYYVDDIPADVLTEHAINGMLKNLDPYSSYLTPDDAKLLKMVTEGSFSGIGAIITLEDNLLKVVSVIPQGPSEIAGLKAGDKISHINGTPINKDDLYENILRLRGKEGSYLNIRLVQPKEITVVIQRGNVDIKEVSYKTLRNNIAHIEIRLFSNDTVKDLTQAINNAVQNKSLAIIFDIRGNPGGLLYSAIDATALLLDKVDYPFSDITHIIEKDRVKHIPVPPRSKDISDSMPIFILIDENTASGAEIFASALQYHERAILIGQNTKGKGSVQSLIPLQDKSMIKLTTAYFTTPNGGTINQTGVKPNFEINLESEEALISVQEIIFNTLIATETNNDS